MLKVSKNLFLLCFLLIFSSLSFAQNLLVLYPPTKSTLIYTYPKFYKDDNILKISNLPLGLNLESVYILNPEFSSWKYSFDLQDKKTFYKNNIGRSVYLDSAKKNYSAQILNYNENEDLFIKKNNTILLNPPNKLIFPYRRSLNTSPTLTIYLKKNKTKNFTPKLSLGLTSLESNINYQAFFNEEKKELKFSAYVQIQNKSHQNLEKLKIKVKVSPKVFPPQTRNLKMMRTSSFTPDLKPAAGSYIYELPGQHYLTRNSTTTIPIIQNQLISAQKVYRYITGYPLYSPNQPEKNVDIYLKIKNNLAIPLSSGQLQIIDTQNSVINTQLPALAPEQETYIFYDKSMDITAKKILLNRNENQQQQIDEYKIIITNYQKEYTLVEIIDHILGKNWQITNSNYKHTKLDANKIKFEIMAPASKNISIIYKVVRDKP